MPSGLVPSVAGVAVKGEEERQTPVDVLRSAEKVTQLDVLRIREAYRPESTRAEEGVLAGVKVLKGS